MPLTIIANPVLTILDGADEHYFEGCLSIDGYRAVVPRASHVRVTGWDRHGQPVTLTAKGWLARILQHEIDHLNGALYLDSMYIPTFISERHFVTDWLDANPEKIKAFAGLAL